MDINQFAKEVHENAKAHGWWEEDRSFGEIIALCHSELSEAMEEHRDGHAPDEIYYNCEEDDHELHPCAPEDEFDCINAAEKETCPHRGNKPEGVPIEPFPKKWTVKRAEKPKET